MVNIDLSDLLASHEERYGCRASMGVSLGLVAELCGGPEDVCSTTRPETG